MRPLLQAPSFALLNPARTAAVAAHRLRGKGTEQDCSRGGAHFFPPVSQWVHCLKALGHDPVSAPVRIVLRTLTTSSWYSSSEGYPLCVRLNVSFRKSASKATLHSPAAFFASSKEAAGAKPRRPSLCAFAGSAGEYRHLSLRTILASNHQKRDFRIRLSLRLSSRNVCALVS